MRICLLTSTSFPLIGGLEVVVHNLATALSGLGHDVILVTPRAPNRKIIDNYSYRVVRFGFKGYGRLKLVSAAAVLTLAYVVRRFNIDVINVHNVFTPASWAYIYGRFNKKVPIIGTPHGDDIQIKPEIQFGVRRDSKSDKTVRRNLGSFTRITSISQSIRKTLSDLVDNKDKIIDVPNGAWVKNYQKNININNIRKKFGIPLNTIVIISIGRNHAVKGFEYGLEAVAKLRKSGVSISYILVGREMSPIVKKAQALSVSDCLITPGQVDSELVSQLLQSSDIYLSSSISESFGLTTLEAMSAGLPCIVTDIPGSRDLVSPSFSLVVKPRDSKQISTAIKYLIENPSIRDKFGSKARIEALKYDWPQIAKTYIKAYQQAISSRS